MLAPDNLSVNDGILPELCSLEYTKISDVVTELSKMGPGTLLAKIDIKSAYHIIPIHQADSLTCQFQHATNVMKPGRSFLRRIIVLAKLAQKPWNHIRIFVSMHPLAGFVIVKPYSSR